MSGLCGNYNNDPSDHLTDSVGNQHDDVNIFATSYQVGSCGNSEPPVVNGNPCTLEQQDKWLTRLFVHKKNIRFVIIAYNKLLFNKKALVY